VNTKKLKTLKDLKIKNPYQIERLSLLFEHGVYHTKKAVKTELGLKRIVDIQKKQKETAISSTFYEVYNGIIQMLMEIFNITKEDIEKFKGKNK